MTLLTGMLLQQEPPQWMQAERAKFHSDQADPPGLTIWVKISEQRLYLADLKSDSGKILNSYPISSSRYGVGNQQNSYKTPLGVHRVAQKIGQECQQYEVIKARIPTGMIIDCNKEKIDDEQDLITSRILWLEGLEPGINQGEGIDSYQRYIYIHGTAAEHLIGQPASIGCVRMKNKDVIELYTKVEEGVPVIIVE